mmetsp:Transcript_3776/g.13493  ORF Transcript_3776/g.13493 Transcript_3776/m.13493 type:complete len:524 (+) Transcript_3776:187-1758(+)
MKGRTLWFVLCGTAVALPHCAGKVFKFTQQFSPIDNSYQATVKGIFTGEDMNGDGYIKLSDMEVFTFGAVFESNGPVATIEFDSRYTIVNKLVYEVGSGELGDVSEEELQSFRAILDENGTFMDAVGYVVNDFAVGPGGLCDLGGLGSSFPCSALGTDAYEGFDVFSVTPVTVVEDPATISFPFLQGGYSDGSTVSGVFEAIDYDKNWQISSFLAEVVAFSMTFDSPTLGQFTYTDEDAFDLVYDLGSGFIGDGSILDVEGIMAQDMDTIFSVGDGPAGSQLCDGQTECATFLTLAGDMLTSKEAVLVKDPTTAGATVLSDPHIQTLHGSTFDFEGVTGRVYTMISHREGLVSVLARFGSAYATGVSFAEGNLLPYHEEGTWISSMVVALTAGDGTAVVLIVSPDSGEGDLSYGTFRVLSGTDNPAVKITVNNKASYSAIAFNATHMDGEISIVPPKPAWDVPLDQRTRFTHMNFKLQRLSPSVHDGVGGILAISTGEPGYLVDEANFEADKFVGADLLNLVP